MSKDKLTDISLGNFPEIGKLFLFKTKCEKKLIKNY